MYKGEIAQVKHRWTYAEVQKLSRSSEILQQKGNFLLSYSRSHFRKIQKKMYSTCKSFSFHEQFSLTCAVSNEYPLNFFANLSDYIMIDVHTYIHTYTHIMQKYKKRQMLASRIVLTRRQAFDRFFRFLSILSSDAILPTY